MDDRRPEGGHLATGLGSPISWLLYCALAAFVGLSLAPFWREAVLAFLCTAAVGLLWLGRCRRCRRRQRREEALARLDDLSGADFERWITTRLLAAGHAARDLQHSGDFGVDVLAEVGGLRLGIQAKRSGGTVGNEAVQEVLAGCDYHRCEVAAVITQARFTSAAREQAARARYPVVLVDRDGVLDLALRLEQALGGGALRRRLLARRAQRALELDRAG